MVTPDVGHYVDSNTLLRVLQDVWNWFKISHKCGESLMSWWQAAKTRRSALVKFAIVITTLHSTFTFLFIFSWFYKMRNCLLWTPRQIALSTASAAVADGTDTLAHSSFASRPPLREGWQWLGPYTTLHSYLCQPFPGRGEDIWSIEIRYPCQGLSQRHGFRALG